MAADLILVPRGAEHTSVVGGLKNQLMKTDEGLKNCAPIVLSIPIGVHALSYLQCLAQGTDVSPWIEHWQDKTVLLMGLGGSLSPQYRVGDIVISQSISLAKPSSSMDGGIEHRDDRSVTQAKALNQYVMESSLVQALYQALEIRTAQMERTVSLGIVHGVTSDRIITTPEEKQHLAQTYKAELVDMEGVYVLDFFQQRGAKVAMVRVISDRCDRTIPDLNSAIDANGALNSGMMAVQFLRQPRAAAHLIQGSLRGLKCLKLISACCAAV